MHNRISGFLRHSNGHQHSGADGPLCEQMFGAAAYAPVCDCSQHWRAESEPEMEAFHRAHPSAREMVRDILGPELSAVDSGRLILEMVASRDAGSRFPGPAPAGLALTAADGGGAPPAGSAADCVFGVDFFDSLAAPDLDRALRSALRWCRPGATLYAIMDAPPQLSAEIANARRQSELVFPHYSQTENGRLLPEGLIYIEEKDFAALHRTGDDRIRRFLDDYHTDPLKTLTERRAELHRILPGLFELCCRQGCIQREELSFAEMRLKDMAQAAAYAGFGEVAIAQDSTRERSGMITTVAWVRAMKPIE